MVWGKKGVKKRERKKEVEGKREMKNRSKNKVATEWRREKE